jgi:hypothetical protein
MGLLYLIFCYFFLIRILYKFSSEYVIIRIKFLKIYSKNSKLFVILLLFLFILWRSEWKSEYIFIVLQLT